MLTKKDVSENKKNVILARKTYRNKNTKIKIFYINEMKKDPSVLNTSVFVPNIDLYLPEIKGLRSTILSEIFKHLSASETLKMALVCKEWQKISRNDRVSKKKKKKNIFSDILKKKIWKNHFLRDFDTKNGLNEILKTKTETKTTTQIHTSPFPSTNYPPIQKIINPHNQNYPNYPNLPNYPNPNNPYPNNIYPNPNNPYPIYPNYPNYPYSPSNSFSHSYILTFNENVNQVKLNFLQDYKFTEEPPVFYEYWNVRDALSEFEAQSVSIQIIHAQNPNPFKQDFNPRCGINVSPRSENLSDSVSSSQEASSEICVKQDLSFNPQFTPVDDDQDGCCRSHVNKIAVRLFNKNSFKSLCSSFFASPLLANQWMDDLVSYLSVYCMSHPMNDLEIRTKLNQLISIQLIKTK